MAKSCCPKCESTRFEMETHGNDVLGAEYKMNFIQCASCGAVVGVMPYISTEYMMGKIADHLGVKLFD